MIIIFPDGPGSNIVRQMPSNLCNDPSRIQSPAQNPALEQQRIAGIVYFYF